MGFFSAIKKFFGKDKKQDEENRPLPEPDQQASVDDESPNPVEPPSAAKESAKEDQREDETHPGESKDEAEPEPRSKPSGNVAEAPAPPREVVTQGGHPEIAPETPPVTVGNADEAMLIRLRAAEPRLSAWLNIILENLELADDEFWRRLRFLLESLEAPQGEIDAFLADFQRWLTAMEYVYIDEFRSELQYRLALALELEDEEDERNRLFLKLSQSLNKTREQLGKGLDLLLSGYKKLDDDFWDELEELFIMGDLGYDASVGLVSRLREEARKRKTENPEDVREILREILNEIFAAPRGIRTVNKPEVVLMTGVNGAGKTTTIGKLAYREKMRGRKPLIVAADTFRAAAIEQLEVWAKRAGADFFAKKAGADPASVAWEAMDYALKNDIDVVFIDTAGRLQTKVNLMDELGKIRQVLGKKHPGAPHRSALVLDATTGQNALSQAKLFKESADVNELILTKIDGTAKGGVAIAVAMREKLPISFVGLGEKMEDLRPFDGASYAAALLERESGKRE